MPFWTLPISNESGQIDFDAETASLVIENLPIPDFHDIRNALYGGPSVDSIISFNIQWSDVVRRLRVINETDGFEGRFIEDKATAEWSVEQEGFRFESDPASTSTNVYSVIGLERNGVFFEGRPI